jgi:hypothetical protein
MSKLLANVRTGMQKESAWAEGRCTHIQKISQ